MLALRAWLPVPPVPAGAAAPPRRPRRAGGDGGRHTVYTPYACDGACARLPPRLRLHNIFFEIAVDTKRHIAHWVLYEHNQAGFGPCSLTRTCTTPGK